jgi:hypothetical protein
LDNFTVNGGTTAENTQASDVSLGVTVVLLSIMSERLDRIDATLETMLAVQRDLQNTQLNLQSTQLNLQSSQLLHQQRVDQQLEAILAIGRDLQERQLRQQDELDRIIRIVDRLVGYSISSESDRLDLEEKMTALERRVRKLEPPEQ